MPRWLSRCSHSGIQIDRIHISTLGSFWYLVVCHNTPQRLQEKDYNSTQGARQPVQAFNHSTQDAESQS